MRALLCGCLFLLASIGLGQTGYTDYWQRTLGSADNERNPHIIEAIDNIVAYERVAADSSVAIYATCYDGAGTLKWSKNLSSLTPGTKNTIINFLFAGNTGYLTVRRNTSLLQSRTVVYAVNLDTGALNWTYTSGNDRAPRAVAYASGYFIIATQSFLSNGYGIRLNAGTGAFVREDLINTSAGVVYGGDAIYENGAYHAYFMGSLNGNPTVWKCPTDTTFTATSTSAGIDQGEWTQISVDGLHLYGVIHDASGNYRAIHGYRTTLAGAWVAVPLALPVSAAGLVATSDPSDYLAGYPTQYQASYFHATTTDTVSTVKFHTDGYARLSRTLNTGVLSTSRVAWSGRDTVDYFANNSSSCQLVGIHANPPKLPFTRLKEAVNDVYFQMTAGTYQTPAGDTNIVIHRIFEPCLPDPAVSYDIATRTTAFNSLLSFYSLPLPMFGFGSAGVTTGFQHGTIVNSSPSYYQPALNFIGSDTATYSVGNQHAPVQFTVNVGLTPRVLGVYFKNLGEVIGGRTIEAKVKISRAAPSGGVVVPLSTNSSLISVPASVTVPAGQDFALFLVSSLKVFSSTSRKVIYGPGANDNVDVSIIPGGLNTFNIGPTSVKGGQSATGSVSMTGNLPTYLPGATVSISVNGGNVSFPSAITLAPGTGNKTFTITTTTVAATVVRTFTVTQGVTQKTATLTITP